MGRGARDRTGSSWADRTRRRRLPGRPQARRSGRGGGEHRPGTAGRRQRSRRRARQLQGPPAVGARPPSRPGRRGARGRSDRRRPGASSGRARRARVRPDCAARSDRERIDQVPVEITVAEDRFVAGEESAVVSAIEGRPALPGDKLRRVVESGVHARPTVVKNVEIDGPRGPDRPVRSRLVPVTGHRGGAGHCAGHRQRRRQRPGRPRGGAWHPTAPGPRARGPATLRTGVGRRLPRRLAGPERGRQRLVLPGIAGQVWGLDRGRRVDRAARGRVRDGRDRPDRGLSGGPERPAMRAVLQRAAAPGRPARPGRRRRHDPRLVGELHRLAGLTAGAAPATTPTEPCAWSAAPCG